MCNTLHSTHELAEGISKNSEAEVSDAASGGHVEQPALDDGAQLGEGPRVRGAVGLDRRRRRRRHVRQQQAMLRDELDTLVGVGPQVVKLFDGERARVARHRAVGAELGGAPAAPRRHRSSRVGVDPAA